MSSKKKTSSGSQELRRSSRTAGTEIVPRSPMKPAKKRPSSSSAGTATTSGKKQKAAADAETNSKALSKTSSGRRLTKFIQPADLRPAVILEEDDDENEPAEKPPKVPRHQPTSRKVSKAIPVKPAKEASDSEDDMSSSSDGNTSKASSPEDSESDDLSPQQIAVALKKERLAFRDSSKRQHDVPIEIDSDEDHVVPVKPRSRPAHPIVLSEDEEIEEIEVPAPKKKKKGVGLSKREEARGHEGDEDTEGNEVPAPKKKKKSVPSKREEARARENPTWSKQSSTKKDTAIKEEDPSLTIVTFTDAPPLYKNLKGRLPLLKQDSTIIETCREAKALVRVALLFETVYPDTTAKGQIITTALRTAAKSLGIPQIRARIREDPQYRNDLGVIVSECISFHRKDVKDKAAEYIGLYLPISDPKEQSVLAKAWLAKNNYIWPGDPTKSNGMKNNSPYGHPVVIAIIKDLYFKSLKKKPALSARFIDKCVSSLNGKEEKELPVVMIAMVATGIHAVLQDRQNGEVSDLNSTDLFGVYEWHLNFLGSIKAESPSSYHRLLSKLYMKASEISSTSHDYAPSEALARLDFQAMDTD